MAPDGRGRKRAAAPVCTSASDQVNRVWHACLPSTCTSTSPASSPAPRTVMLAQQEHLQHEQPATAHACQEEAPTKQQQQHEQPLAQASAMAAAEGTQLSACEAPPAKRSRPRKLVGQPGAPAAAGAAAEQEPKNAYERQRAERMAHNRKVLQEMGVQEAAQQMQRANVPGSTSEAGDAAGTGKGQQKKVPRQQRSTAPVLPARQSARLRAAVDAVPAADGKLGGDDGEQGRGEYQEELLTQSDYFAALGQPLTGFKVDGEYHGWVSPAICERYGIAASAAEAWASNGGGAFKRTISKADVPAHLRAKGWSDARAFSSTMLLKNPNTYFYRHVAPHEQQAQGEWTEEEHELFLATAKQNGVGTKWGLFASHIPQRVGYQCSAYYREVIIPRGLIVDNRFKLTKRGSAVYVGPGGNAQKAA